MTDPDKYSLTVITHHEDHLQSLKTGDLFSWMSFIKEEGDEIEVWVSLIKLNIQNQEIDPSESKQKFKTREEAFNYVKSTTRNFPAFDKKILTIDKKISSEDLENLMMDWIDKQ